MEVTGIVIRKLSPDSKMKAIVSITFDNEFAVHDVKIIDGSHGLFIAMPSRRTPEGEYKDIVHPINSEFRDKVSALVLAKYKETLAQLSEQVAGFSSLDDLTYLDDEPTD
ncbi:MAG: septation regulator SpoVG [Clostridiales bacterium]|nr:septation regulator SpoVG [Clostridiales bacterium]